MAVDAAKVGFMRDSEEFRVNTARLAQFAAALDDTNAEHLAGRLAPPTFAHVPVMQSMVEVVQAATGAFALHGEHDFHFHRPIEPGQRLWSVSRLVCVANSRAGALIVVRSDTKTGEGADVCTQYTTCLVRGAAVETPVGEAPPPRPALPRNGDPVVVEHTLSDTQTRRYAEAARDYSAYTLDPAAAKALGFPAPIVHGMCTLGFAARAVVDAVCGGQSRRLKRLACRFSAPVLVEPGQKLTTSLWSSPVNGRLHVTFETAEKTGAMAIRNGFAEVVR